MCGITGFISEVASSEEEMRSIVGRQKDFQKHRGPDGTGIFVSERVALGHNRLSILDLENGAQPMISADGRYALVYNGEFYNHQPFRDQLSKLGYKFLTTCDTETLLYGLIEWGESFITKINGIFAFAWFDGVEQRVILARDHLGIKPLYYDHLAGKGLMFASESKSIIPFVSEPKINHRALLNYLTLLWSPGEDTPLLNVKKLLPGHSLSVDLKQGNFSLEMKRFYDVPMNGVYHFNAENETVNMLDEILNQAVERQLLSDVPVGFFLSGGVDSSVLVAMARKYQSRKLRCFTIDTSNQLSEEGFEDDLVYAQRVARELDVDLNIVPATFNIVRDFDKMIWHLDEPQADSAPLHVYNICQQARDIGYKVLVGGAGGDDVFSGYRRHQIVEKEKYFRLIPGPIGRAASYLPIPTNNPLGRRINKVIEQLGKTTELRLASFFQWIDPDRAKQLFHDPKTINGYLPSMYFQNLLKNIPNEQSWLNRMLYWEMKTFLVDHNLNYTDKMGMACGVEIRVPYLDQEVVEFACRVHPDLKLKNGTTKYILKKVAERYLPKDVVYRSKTGFGSPVRKWVREDLAPMIEDRLLSRQSVIQPIFNQDAIRKLVSDNQSGKVDAAYPIWSLLAIESFIRQFVSHGATMGS